jgi:hypothetical protein
MRILLDEQGREVCAFCLYLIEEQPELGCVECGLEATA